MLNPITDHLDVWASAELPAKTGGRGRAAASTKSPHGIQKMRELILELAVRGKLVPQAASDEPASVLLKKIAIEQAKLIKEKKIKKPNVAAIAEDEMLFSIPTGWEWVRLVSLGNIFNGNSISASDKESKYTNIDGGLPFIATKDVEYGWQDLAYDNGVSIPKGEPKFNMAHKGAVLICAEGGSAGKKCGITNRDIYFGNKLFAIELYGDIASDYILANYLCPTFFEQFREKMTGIIGGISSANFANLVISIPPLAEQHRIVAKVDELMAMCEQLEQEQTDNSNAHQTLVEALLATLTQAEGAGDFAEAWQRIAANIDAFFTTELSIDQLKQAIVELAVKGRLITFPSDTKDYLLKELLTFGPRNGLSPVEVLQKTDIKVLKLGATTKGVLDLSETKYVDIDIKKDSHLWIRDGDILVQRGNAAQYVGCNVVVSGSPQNYIYPDLMMKLIPNAIVSPDYLSLCLSAKSAREFMWSQMTGTSGTMPKISKKVVETIPMVVPCIEVQKQVLLLVNQLLDLLDEIQVRLKTSKVICAQLADAIVEQAVV